MEGYHEPPEWTMSRLCEEFNCLPGDIRGGGATGLNELMRIVEYRGIARTVAYLDEVESMDAKHRPTVKETPMVRLVRDIRSESYARVKTDGIKRKQAAQYAQGAYGG